MIKLAWALFCLGLTAPLAAEIQLQHHDGETLLLPGPARKIVTLAPNLAELVYAAGGGQYLLASVEYSDYPAAARGIPRIGDAFRFDLEALLDLRPDLVISWASGNPEALLDRAEQLGLTVWRTELRQLGDIPELLRALGSAMATSQIANNAAADFDSELAALTSQYRAVSPVTYFYQVAERPLYTVNGKHLISQALGLCGGSNVFAQLDTLAPSISAESVIAADPEVMFAPAGNGMQGGLEQWRRWLALSAVRQDHLYYLNADRISRATPRFLETLTEACKYLAQSRQQRGKQGAGPLKKEKEQ
jgi:iron complex transport system substrate-binding protein